MCYWGYYPWVLSNLSVPSRADSLNSIGRWAFSLRGERPLSFQDVGETCGARYQPSRLSRCGEAR
jgi:hypothetical protein